MIYRKIDENGDYVFGSNAACFLSGAEAVAQAILTRLRLLKYEWWESLEEGLPLWQKIAAQRDKDAAEQEIRDRIVQTKHVLAIISWNSSWDNEKRSLAIHTVVDTDYGTLEVNEVM